MSPNDARVIEWIRAAAERIPTDPTTSAHQTTNGRPTDPLQDLNLVGDIGPPQADQRVAGRLLLVAASVVVLVTGIVLLSRAGQPDGVASPLPVFNDVLQIPDGAPEPGSVLPHLDSPPDWFGPPIEAERASSNRTGRWTSAAIGIGDATIMHPITISATDGSSTWLASAKPITINGQSVRSIETNGHTLLASNTNPAIIVGGAVDNRLLLDVLNATVVVDRDGVLALNLTSLPAEYSVQVHPQVQAIDPPFRPTLTNEAGDVAINEVSEWVNAELNAAETGASYSTAVVAGQPAWTGRTEFNPFGPLTFVIWSPQAGVVFQITSSNSERTVADLIQLAESTSTLAAEETFVCPITIPDGQPFVPPAPWPQTPTSSNMRWFGTDALWTPLDVEGHTPRKSVWWSANFPGGVVEEMPELEVIYERLDIVAEPVVFASPGTNALAQDGDFMINGIEPDEPGCWEATATYKGASLSYVYKVE